jgi:tRNA(Ile)-lysidine synthase
VTGRTLGQRLRAQFTGDDWAGATQTVLVALSGGLDSLVLLHLLRFEEGLPEMRLLAAHFDHGMRSSSGSDAEWVRGLCRAWAVPLHLGRAASIPTSEEKAREARYEFLLGSKDQGDASWLLTAHHADDQAETVLFRVFRGTGLSGLAGIPRRRSPGIFRPLLPFSRETLEGYASFHGIQPRLDPSNEDVSIPRNYLRHRVIPQVEGAVAGGARSSLQRLARLARENEEAWESLLPEIMQGVVEESERGIVVVRSALLAYHPAVQGRVLRHVARRHGLTLSEAGTRGLLEFTTTGASGRSYQLSAGLRLCREFDTFLLDTGDTPGEDCPLLIPGLESGSGEATLGGRKLSVFWGQSEERGGEASAILATEALAFPLRLRGWAPGDRISLPHGGKKLKKLFGEAGIPAGVRDRVPVLVDSAGRVLWVGGVAVSVSVRADSHQVPFYIGIRHVDEP